MVQERMARPLRTAAGPQLVHSIHGGTLCMEHTHRRPPTAPPAPLRQAQFCSAPAALASGRGGYCSSGKPSSSCCTSTSVSTCATIQPVGRSSRWQACRAGGGGWGGVGGGGRGYKEPAAWARRSSRACKPAASTSREQGAVPGRGARRSTARAGTPARAAAAAHHCRILCTEVGVVLHHAVVGRRAGLRRRGPGSRARSRVRARAAAGPGQAASQQRQQLLHSGPPRQQPGVPLLLRPAPPPLRADAAPCPPNPPQPHAPAAAGPTW
jgi:hypothetical protein